jgi:DNA-binding NarL/FixJ family response regulator
MEEPLSEEQLKVKDFVIASPIPDKLLRNLGRAHILEEGEPINRQHLDERPLTATELDVIRWVSHGLEDKMIAEVTGRSHYSVKDSLKYALRKLRAKNRSHAACIALRQGLID